MYVSVDFTPGGRPIGGSIATPGKEPESQIHRLVETLSTAVNEALTEAGEVISQCSTG